jgi:ribosomal protein L17
MSEMTDRELIGYCRIHCTTERALFHRQHVNRMLDLAKHPDYFARVDQEWLSIHEGEMLPLCDRAEERLKATEGASSHD